MGRPDDLLLLWGKISREAHDAFRPHPDAPVRDFDVLEHVCDRKLLLLALRCLACIVRKRRDVDEPDDAVIRTRCRDDAATVGVADEDGRAADSPERPFYCGDVAFGGVEAILGGDHLVALGLKRRDHLAEA